MGDSADLLLEESMEEPVKKKSKKKYIILGFLSLSPFLFIAIILMGFALMFLLMIGGVQEKKEEGIIGGNISEIGEKEIPAEYIPIYQAAAKKYGVPWNLLAAHHRVETRFSTIKKMVSPVGAVGHMQFMVLTWIGWGYGGDRLGNANIPKEILTDPKMIKKYGGYGVDANGDGKADPWDLEDAVFSAANYLAKNGAAEGNLRKAVYAYNHSEQYVQEVLKFAKMYADGDYQKVSKITAGKSGFARPLNTKVTSGFGRRVDPITGAAGEFHKGIDFACTKGQTIPAAKDGKVVYSGWQNPNNKKEGYGLFVWVDHGGGYKTTYAHMSKSSVKVGDTVKMGDKVGECGSTGSSTGNHLHFEIFQNGNRVDPSPFVGLK
ncbi:peptidoglycan DD-metalloendopeptidase family protein [Bacillus haynesii]|uniref:peptidoglycan DD-metalloendopeptidase family protein n=1 Tax=Bacillus haynesii TaxID=1925021 RepID=UPI002280940B|nr:peptidoglycan DD-metalloendopeptidase family protein [Bacillus haynesii]MCY7780191.1 peptidoglycan DD-metalloendopeptidase family protein [Bacillus haynesii]MEC0672768.1 peptidoglycan DD-metalloendopeptidase family protein [Bacillus haynesii]